MRRSLAGWLGRSGSRPAAASGSGRGALLRHASMDERFRRVCAVHSDGRCLIVAGFETDNRLRATLLELRRDGAVPTRLREETATADEVAAIWRRADDRRTDAGEAPAARLVARLFAEAAAARASDVAFECDRDACRVFCIVNDRKLPLTEPLPAGDGREAMGFLFHCKDEGSAQTSYQRGAFQGFSVRAGGPVPLPETVSALRCQRGPHEPDGDHLFARLFYRDRIEPGMTLERLGFSAEEAAVFAEVRASLHGGIFLGGTAGDGKSTTLATNLALQMEEADGQLNVVTVEDPVEYPIPGAVQIAVPTTGSGEARGRHFKEALMHFCRVHPASGMVSEIRDADAARQVLQFIDTGHQIWSTIHVHSANAVLFRLLDMGVGAPELCKPGNVALLMKQTLMPRLCATCGLDRPHGGREVPAWLAGRLRGRSSVRFRNPEGCAACRRGDRGDVAGRAWNGYSGQTAIAEILRPDTAYLSFVRARDPAGAWEHWVTEMGGAPIGVRIGEMVASGTADPFDALRKGARIGRAEAGSGPTALVGERAA